jgi:hypothetical protein
MGLIAGKLDDQEIQASTLICRFQCEGRRSKCGARGDPQLNG